VLRTTGGALELPSRSSAFWKWSGGGFPWHEAVSTGSGLGASFARGGVVASPKSNPACLRNFMRARWFSPLQQLTRRLSFVVLGVLTLIGLSEISKLDLHRYLQPPKVSENSVR
jgi:hypothetical protein